jgi:uracil-DNA glycosylase
MAGQLSLDETAAPLVPERPSLQKLPEAATAYTACDLYRTGIQTVFGEGAAGTKATFVGEQPGDQEDKAGRPVESDLAEHVLATIHPSAILRGDPETREQEYAAFVADLKAVAALL